MRGGAGKAEVPTLKGCQGQGWMSSPRGPRARAQDPGPALGAAAAAPAPLAAMPGSPSACAGPELGSPAVHPPALRHPVSFQAR